MSKYEQAFCISWVIVFTLSMIGLARDGAFSCLKSHNSRQDKRICLAFITSVMISCALVSAVIALFLMGLWMFITKE